MNRLLMKENVANLCLLGPEVRDISFVPCHRMHVSCFKYELVLYS
jgi:hypothetical protein